MKIGLIIADESEYIMIREKAEELCARRTDFFTREGHVFSLDENTEVWSVLCGVGMINAAAAATYLSMQGCKTLLSFGLSGGINGIARNEFMVGTEYIEHDFDLTPLGYELCEKPLQNYVYKGDVRLSDMVAKRYPFIKSGVVVSGDSFISDNSKKSFLKEKFNAMSCDMESAAIAYVAEIAGIPFMTLRKISDDAGDTANDSYKQAINIDGVQVREILFDIIKQTSVLLSK